MRRVDEDPLEAAILWIGKRVSVVKVGVGAAATLVGVSAGVAFLFFELRGIIGGLIAAAIVALSLSIGRLVTSVMLRALLPYWIAAARRRFALDEAVLRELRSVLG